MSEKQKTPVVRCLSSSLCEIIFAFFFFPILTVIPKFFGAWMKASLLPLVPLLHLLENLCLRSLGNLALHLVCFPGSGRSLTAASLHSGLPVTPLLVPGFGLLLVRWAVKLLSLVLASEVAFLMFSSVFLSGRH